jgi:hypothetical protein
MALEPRPSLIYCAYINIITHYTNILLDIVNIP